MPGQVSVSLTPDILDAALYSPLERLVKSEYPPRFQRVYDVGTNRAGIDVQLREGSFVSNILELGCNAMEPRIIFFGVSRLRNNIVEPWWFLDDTRHTDFYMICYPECTDSDIIYFRALMVARTKLLRTLDALGCDRRTLGHRETIIRESNKPGLYQTSCPGLSLYFNVGLPSKPISLAVQTDLLSKTAAADVHVSYDPGINAPGMLTGRWLTQQLRG